MPVPNLLLHRRFLLLGSYAVGGSFITLFMRFFTFYFDSYTQSFFRFLAGSLALLLISVRFYPQDLAHALRDRRFLSRMAFLTVLSAAAGLLFVEGLARTSAALGALLATLGVPLSIAMAALVFDDERALARGERFLLGITLALGGAVGLTLSQGGPQTAFDQGALLLIVSALLVAGTALLTKRLVVAYHPLCVGGINSAMLCIGYLLSGLLWGDLGQVTRAPLAVVLLMLGSGVVGLLIGMGLYLVNIQRYGVIMTRVAELAMPLFTGLFGYLLFREALTPQEAIFGIILLIGCALVMLGHRGSRPSSERTQHA